jgi:hypothetical protein
MVTGQGESVDVDGVPAIGLAAIRGGVDDRQSFDDRVPRRIE